MTFVLFVHDHVFSKDGQGRTYSEGKLTDEVFSRYLALAEKVSVICRMRTVTRAKDLVQVKASYVQLMPCRGTRFPLIFSIYGIGNLWHIFKQVKNSKAGVLRMPSFLSIVAAMFYLILRKPYFCEVVGFPQQAIQQSGGGFGRRMLATLVAAICRFVVARAKGSIYVTEHALQSDMPTRGFTAHASNVELAFNPIQRAPEAYQCQSGVCRIGLIGSYNNRYKGIDIAVRALSILKTNGMQVRLLILGSGDPQEINQLADEIGVQEQLEFCGVRQGGKAVLQWLDELDIYIQPSRTEGLPRALVEAMSRGLPCVGTDVGGIPELLQDDWLVPADAPNALADSLALLIENEETRAVVGNRNSEKSREYSSAALKDARRRFWDRGRRLLDSELS